MYLERNYIIEFTRYSVVTQDMEIQEKLPCCSGRTFLAIPQHLAYQ